MSAYSNFVQGKPDGSRVSVTSPSTPLRMPRRLSNSSRVPTLRAVESAWTMPAADQTTAVVADVAAAASAAVVAAVEVAAEVVEASETAAAVAASVVVVAAVVDLETAVAVEVDAEAQEASRARRSPSRRTVIRTRPSGVTAQLLRSRR